MITGIRLDNFQGNLGEQAVELGQVSLIMGANSTGKSSIGRALKIMAQTLESASITADNLSVIPVLKGDRTDLSKEQIGFGGRWGDRRAVSLGVGLEDIPFVGNDVWFGLTWSAVWRDPGNYFEFKIPWTEETFFLHVSLENNDYEISFDPEVLLRAYQKHPCPDKILLHLYEKSTEGLQGSEVNPLEYYLPEVIQETYLKFPTNATDPFIDFYLVLVDAAEKKAKWALEHDDLQKAKGSVYALRSHLTKYSAQADAGIHENRVTFNGEMQAAFLMQLLQECISTAKESLGTAQFPAPTRRVPDFVSETDLLEPETLKRVNLDLSVLTDGRYQLISQRIYALDRTFWQYALLDSYSGVATGFDAVGQGFTQLLEILTALNSVGSFVFLQQPDLHLHPKIIGQLTELLIDRSANKQILIETHSETILNRLQKRVRSSKTGKGANFEFKLVFADSITPREITPLDIEAFNELCQSQEWSPLGQEEARAVLESSLGSRLSFRANDILPEEFVSEPKHINQELQEFLLARMGFNFVKNIQIDHLGDLIDPLPISFADLRVQDLFN